MQTDNRLADRTRAFYEEVWNRRNDSAINEFVAAELVEHGLYGIEAIRTGITEFRVFRSNFLLGYPDAHYTIEKVLVEGDRVSTRYRVQGTHTGDVMGFPATGRRFEFSGICTSRWSNGRIIEIWNSYDQLGLMRQLGLMP